MSLCPVPYILAGAWLYRHAPELARHRNGRVALTAIACGATGVMYVIQLQWRQFKKNGFRWKAAPPLPVGLDRRRFGLSDSGFVPDESDLCRQLPDEFRIWEDTAARVPELRTAPVELRRLVEAWPQLDHQVLFYVDGCRDDFAPAVRRAYSVLTMVAHGYVWCDPENPPEALPSALAVPLHATATCLGLPPVLTHAAADLWNWRRTSHSGASPGDQERYSCINTMTGTRDEEWFYCTSTAVQTLAGPVILGAYDVLAEAIPNADVPAIKAWLEDCAARLEAMASTLSRLADQCGPEVFWKQMRPLLQGFGGGATLKEGIVYTGVEQYGGRPQRFAGASAAQSSAIPVLDAVLGVQHREGEKAFAKEMRRYMPSRHREFLELVQAQPSIRQVLRRWQEGARKDVSIEEVASLMRPFNKCLESLADFRRSHWRLVGTHILKQKAMEEMIASGESSGCGYGTGTSSAARGTGGSPLEDFLQGTVAATLAARL